MHRTFLWIFLISLLTLTTACNPDKTTSQQGDPPPEEVKKKPSGLSLFLEHYESYFKTHMAANGIPGAAVAIVKDDSVVFMKGFGYRELGRSGKVDEETLFRIGSLSKGFAGVLTGILVQEGALKWEDKVVSHLPDFALHDAEQGNRIEINHLLSQSTGLPRHTFSNLVEDGLPLSEIMERLPEAELIGKEGEKYAYQNATYALIEEVILAKTGTVYTDWLADKILKPGNLGSVSTNYQAFMDSRNKAEPHQRMNGYGYEVIPVNEKYFNAVAAGGVNANISDMATWMKILLGGRPDIISPAGLDEVFEPQVSSAGDDYFNKWDGVNESYYAHGWRVLDYEDKRLIHHGGMVNQYRSELAFDRKENIGICILFNGQSLNSRTCIPSFFEMYELYGDLSALN